MLHTYKLKNGLNVATYSLPEMKSVFLSLAVKGGYLLDTPKTSGLAHFMEHLLFEGTPTFPNVEVLSDYVEELAGNFNAFTDVEKIRFYISAPAKHLKKILQISAEAWFESLFPQDAIERERGAILQEIRQRQDSVWYKNGQFFKKIRFKEGHPLLLDGGGSEESIKKLTRDDLVSFWQKLFYPKNTYLILVGGFETNKAEQLIKEIFGKYSQQSSFQFPKLSNKDFTSKTIAIREDEKLQSCYIDLTFPSVTGNDPLVGHLNQAVISSVLGGLRKSRLHRLLRQRRGLVYQVSFGAAVYKDFGYAFISSQAALENLEEVVRLISQELASFIKNGPLKEEVEFAKNYRINRSLMAFDHPSTIADWIESDLMWEDKIYLPEEYAHEVKKVDTQDLVKFMANQWNLSPLTLTVQGPLRDNKSNLKTLEKLTSVIDSI